MKKILAWLKWALLNPHDVWVWDCTECPAYGQGSYRQVSDESKEHCLNAPGHIVRGRVLDGR